MCCLNVCVQRKVASGYISMKNRLVSVKKHVLRVQVCPTKLKEIFAVD